MRAQVAKCFQQRGDSEYDEVTRKWVPANETTAAKEAETIGQIVGGIPTAVQIHPVGVGGK